MIGICLDSTVVMIVAPGCCQLEFLFGTMCLFSCFVQILLSFCCCERSSMRKVVSNCIC